MNEVNKTLYIPLYGKAYVSQRGLFLDDPKAEEIWKSEGFALKGKSASKWLAYYMGVRSAVFDDWLRRQMAEDADAVVIQIGCGLDSRVLRVGTMGHAWVDVDFPEVIAERRRYYRETAAYRMIAGDVRESGWLEPIGEHRRAIVVMEGVSMYLNMEELQAFFAALDGRFERIALLMDCYSGLAAKASKYKNPINDVGVTTVYGLDDPAQLHGGALVLHKEHEMTPQAYIDELKGFEKCVFSSLYAGAFAKKLYRLFEYRKG